jgi:hypothetical protein
MSWSDDAITHCLLKICVLTFPNLTETNPSQSSPAIPVGTLDVACEDFNEILYGYYAYVTTPNSYFVTPHTG